MQQRNLLRDKLCSWVVKRATWPSQLVNATMLRDELYVFAARITVPLNSHILLQTCLNLFKNLLLCSADSVFVPCMDAYRHLQNEFH